MNNKTLEKLCAELSAEMIGRKFGKIFSLSRFQFAIDFRLPESRYLFISIEPSAPRVYLIRRRLRDLEKSSRNPTPFLIFLKKKLANAILQKIEKVPSERILQIFFGAKDELGEDQDLCLTVQLTGRSANLFLLDENDFVIDSLRENRGKGQEKGQKFAPPVRIAEKVKEDLEENFSEEKFRDLSEALDAFYLEKEAAENFEAKAKAARNHLIQQIKKGKKQIKNLEADLEKHGDPEKWKRFGDLILANLADAVRVDKKILVVDYFDQKTPTLEIEIDENISLTEAAEKFFKKYTKARNAKDEISRRLASIRSEIENHQRNLENLEAAILEKNPDEIEKFFISASERTNLNKKKKSTESTKNTRSFISSEGFEILVGKGAKDNDFLTFRIAKSNDLWLHAADYPGSHVVVKNPNRAEIPQKTLLEAAEIAAFYSQAKKQPKAAVHYTQKKFVHKPKGAALGLVSLSSFKTILVEPKISVNVKG